MRLLFGFLLFVLFFPHSAQDAMPRPGPEVLPNSMSELDGNVMLRRCNAAVRMVEGADLQIDEAMEASSCLGYVSGFVDGYGLLSFQLSQKGRPTLCTPPSGAEAQQSARIVAKWLKENPKELHESARVSVLIALSATFPCKSN